MRPRIAMLVPGLWAAIALFTAARIVGIFSDGIKLDGDARPRRFQPRERLSDLLLALERGQLARRQRPFAWPWAQALRASRHEFAWLFDLSRRVTAMGGRIMTRIRAPGHTSYLHLRVRAVASAQIRFRGHADTAPPSRCHLQSGVPSAHAEPYPARVRRGVASTREVHDDRAHRGDAAAPAPGAAGQRTAAHGRAGSRRSSARGTRGQLVAGARSVSRRDAAGPAPGDRLRRLGHPHHRVDHRLHPPVDRVQVRRHCRWGPSSSRR